MAWNRDQTIIVVWTDVIQTVIMIGSILFVIVKGTIDVGGFDVVWKRNWNSERIKWSDPNQVLVERYLWVPSIRKAKQVCLLLAQVFTFYNGLWIFATHNHDRDPITSRLAKAKDQLLPLMVLETLEFLPDMYGLFEAGVFSAAFSTGLSSLVVVYLEDYIKHYRKTPLTENQTAYIMHFIVVLVGVISMALVFLVEYMGHAVRQLSANTSSITGGPFAPLSVA
ncbi:sodium-coupled monocarboxylate transporter 1-like isoform 1-T2 [Cochliomyia hominivorax]